MAPGFAIWITGLPSSGKSSIARVLAERLRSGYGTRVQVLESDALRREITPEPTYSPEERDLFYRALASIGTLLAANGVNVIFDATANRREYREGARKAIPRFIEVYVRCPLEVCQQRDPKGIYRKGREGLTATVPGLQDLYEEPADPEVTVASDRDSPEAGAEMVLEKLKQMSWV